MKLSTLREVTDVAQASATEDVLRLTAVVRRRLDDLEWRTRSGERTSADTILTLDAARLDTAVANLRAAQDQQTLLDRVQAGLTVT